MVVAAVLLWVVGLASATVVVVDDVASCAVVAEPMAELSQPERVPLL